MDIHQATEILLNLARKEAASSEYRLQCRKRLFLFAIEIGRQQRLTPEERRKYEKTFVTALLLSGVAEGQTPPSRFDQVVDGSVHRWLEIEPAVREWLERAVGRNLNDLDQPATMTREQRNMLSECLVMIYGDELRQAEIEPLLDRLEHPLDRA